MSNKRRYWIAVSLAALSTAGCSTTGSLWPSGGWFGSKNAPSGMGQTAKSASPSILSPSGANAQLGSPAPATNAFSGITSSFKKWTGGSDSAAPENDPLNLDNTPKQLTPELSVQVARMHESKGDFPTAIKHYEQALKTSPNNTDVLVGLGRAYDRQGNMPKAIETYQRALKADARCALAHNDLGLCYARQHDLPRAHESLDRAVSLVPTSKLYRNNLATVQVEERQYDAAFENLASVHPPAIAQYNLGVLANRSGDRNEAINRFQLASAADPNLTQARNMIDKLTGVAGQSVPQTPSMSDVRAQAGALQGQVRQQAQQYQTQANDQARQYQTQTRQTAADWKNQLGQQYEQAKTQVDGTRAQFTSQAQGQVQNVQSQVSGGVAQTSEAAQAKIREAEAKLRAALSPQVAPVEAGYGGGWVPPGTDDVTPVSDSAEQERPEGSGYNLSDEAEDDSPVLLPPVE